MNAMQSSVIIIGNSKRDFQDMGAQKVDFEDINWMSPSFKVAVVDLEATPLETMTENLRLAQKSNPHLKIIASLKTKDSEIIYSLLSDIQVFDYFETLEDPQLPQSIVLATEDYDREVQSHELLKLVNEQNQKLKMVSQELESKLEKREKSLQKSQQRLLATQGKTEALHLALVDIHKALSVSELEQSISQSLKEIYYLEWCRIIFNNQSFIEENLAPSKDINTFSAPILFDEVEMGKIIYARKKLPFKKEDIDFLSQVTEGVTLALDHLKKRDQSENLKQQWEATFDAITEPLCLTNTSFDIIKANQAFSKTTKLPFETLMGKNCFKVFTDPTSLKGFKDTPIKSHFRLSRFAGSERRTYEVSCQLVHSIRDKNDLVLTLFRDITEDLRIEKQLLESSKMAELGTIGSSIAHEINNPLAGMTSFLQLIQMDVDEKDSLYPDIKEMNSAARRCKEIVESLLSFSRKHDTSNAQKIDLKEVLHQALKITELKTRSLGINVDIQLPEEPIEVMGEFNLLSQAISGLLQNSQEAISEKLESNPRYDGQIRVELAKSSKQTLLTVTDNGTGMNSQTLKKAFNPLFTTKNPNKKSGLGLTLAYKIINEHGAQLELFSQPNIGTSAKISF